MQKNKPFKGSFDVTDVLRILPLIRKNWWIVALLTGLFYLIGRTYVYKLDKIYQVSEQLLLKNNEDYSTGSLITGSTGGYFRGTYGTYVDNSNEIRVIMSYDLIQKALDKLDFDVSYYIVGRLKTTEVYTGVPFTVKVNNLNNELYEQQIKFILLNDNEYRLDYTIGDKSLTSKGTFGEELLNENMSIVIRRKGTMFGKDVNYVIQPHQKTTVAANILANLKVENPDYTNVLKLSYQDALTDRAVRFLDTLASVYMQNSLYSKLELNKNTVFYIDRQMDEVVNILNNIEDSLQGFRQAHDVIDLDRQSEQYFVGYSNSLQKKKDLEMQIRTLDDLQEYVIENKDPSFLPPDAYKLPGDVFQTQSLTELYDLQISLNSALQVGTPKSFYIINLKNQIDSTRRDLLIYIRNTRTAIQQRIGNVDVDINYYDGELDSLPAKQRGLLSIQRRQRVNEEMYIFLLQKRANTIISKASIVPDVKIIEKSRPTGVVIPDVGKIVSGFTFSGVIVSLFLVLIRIFFFQKIENYDELKGKTHLPIIGEIVYSKLDNDLVIAVDSDPKSALSESFRTIRTNLQFMLAKGNTRAILLTSNNPGEGKTFCSLNIAALFAKSGKKTIILELDLHKPRVQKGLQLEIDKGISTIAAGKHRIEECIVTSRIENLDTLLSGPIPPNPSEIISSRILDDILEYCRQHYEYIIIDTPPVGLITDALVLMPKVDICLFVLNTKYATRKSLESAHEVASMNEETGFGFVLNGVKRKKSKYYYNRYSYGYSYGGPGGYGGYGNYGSYGSYGGYGSYRGYGSSGDISGKSKSAKKK